MEHLSLNKNVWPCVLGGVAVGAAGSFALMMFLRSKPSKQQQVQELIGKFGLIPHPEGGYFVETYRSAAPVMESMGKTDERGRTMWPTVGLEGGVRNEMTSIYWMATAKHHFLWMGLNTSPHVHYYHQGDPFTYILVYPDGKIEEITMGPNPERGHVMQMVVPTGTYKAGYLNSKEDGSFFLVGEGVSPGFDFRDFKFISFEELITRVGVQKAEKYRGFLHDDPSAKNFDAFYK